VRFSRKRQIDMIPSVPSDQTDRREAISRARKKLIEANQSVPKALKVVSRIEHHSNENHYVQRLRVAYGVEAHHD
jgi:hypothetical protein